METLRLQFDSDLKEQIMTFLDTLPAKNIEVLFEDSFFEETKKRLNKSFESLKSGSCKLYDIEELDKKLAESNLVYENKI